MLTELSVAYVLCQRRMQDYISFLSHEPSNHKCQVSCTWPDIECVPCMKGEVFLILLFCSNFILFNTNNSTYDCHSSL